MIDKFPSLKLTKENKLCPSCRIKLHKLPGKAVSSGSSEQQHYSGHDVTTTSTTISGPIVDSANESAADLDIPGPATVEIATEAVADITADDLIQSVLSLQKKVVCKVKVNMYLGKML